jgi:hypothetical protein
VNTRTSSSVEDTSAPSQNPTEPVRTSAEGFAPVQADASPVSNGEPGAHPFEPVRTRLTVQSGSQVEQELRDRLKDKDDENAFLREQLKAAQAEVGKRANSTDEALKTIDRVVRSFEMQAEANKALALGGVPARDEQAEPARPVSRVITPTTDATVSKDHQPTRRYQQPETDWNGV